MKYLLVLFFAILYEICASCPNGTFPNVVGDKCYFIPKDSSQFDPAELSCQNHNGDLASISNAFDNTDLIGKTMGGSFYAHRWLLRAECSALHAV
jgi:hypothetical protein